MALYCIQGAAGIALTAAFGLLQPPKTPSTGELSIPGVRPIGMTVAHLLEAGCTRSATFRELMGILEESDWIVFVQIGSCGVPYVSGCLLHRRGSFYGRPYIRIVISESSRPNDEVIATIGHELQHAVEVVADREVRENGDIRELYRRIGYVAMRAPMSEVYETARAVKVAADVRRELGAKRRDAGRLRTAMDTDAAGLWCSSDARGWRD